MNVYPVIPCGGSGTRLWPMSRRGYPKQYLRLTSDNMLVQQAALRPCGISDITAPILVANNEQRFLVAEQLREVAVNPSSIVLRPVGRNTAPAIAVPARRDSPISSMIFLRRAGAPGETAHLGCHYRKRRPCSPARATSAAGFNAGMLVWKRDPVGHANNPSRLARRGRGAVHRLGHPAYDAAAMRHRSKAP
jgi:hypothetical protein